MNSTQITKRTKDGVWSEEKVAQSCPTLWDPMDCPWNFPDQNTGMGSWISLLQGIFQLRDRTQVSYIAGRFFISWSTRGSPRTEEWVAYPFSRGSSRPRNRTRVSCITGRFFTSWATREAQGSGRSRNSSQGLQPRPHGTIQTLCWVPSLVNTSVSA